MLIKTRTRMQPSKKMRTESAPDRMRQTTIKTFRIVVKRGRKRSAEEQEMYAGGVDMLSDDDIARIFDFLMDFDKTTTGMDYNVAAVAARKAAVCFGLCCKRTASVLKNIATEQQAEILARKATSIYPSSPLAAFPFTDQMQSELVSCDQLRLLREALRAISCHCAKACCANYQKAFNKDVRKCKVLKPDAAICTSTSSVCPISESCSLIDSTPCGKFAFAHVKRRLPKQQHGEGRSRRHQDSLIKYCPVQVDQGGWKKTIFTTKEMIDINTMDYSEPHVMRVSYDASAAVYTASVHAVPGLEDSTPFSSIFLWTPGSDVVRVDPPPRPFPAFSVANSPVLSAQDGWFLKPTCEEDPPLLVVAWSTDFIHPSGHKVGSHAAAKGPVFFFATYTIEDGVAELFEFTDPDEGELITCSPTQSGETALLLVRRDDCYISDRRQIFVKQILEDSLTLVPQTSSPKGASCAAISPTGDAIAALHRTAKSMDLVVLVRTSSVRWSYSPVQSIDISMLIGLQPGMDHVVDPTLLKACFGLQFSPCGRFVLVIDRHPLFGDAAKNHGVVAVDTALRMNLSRSLRPIPLFSTEDQQPRSIQWTRTGFVLCPPGTDEHGSMGPRGGALCIHAPPSHV
jgi:hypothetical protein